MNIFEAIVLGIVQGLTEFIPVSSSGHLIVFHQLLGVTNQGLAFDVALHLGTLSALVIYFHKDIWQLILGLLGRNKFKNLSWLLVLATIPAVISGVLLESAAESTFRSVRLVSLNLIIVALLMLWAEKTYQKSQKLKTKLEATNPKQALSIGLAQAIAIVPGISRSGSTIVAGLFSGLDRVSAMRFSFLLGIPITVGAVLKVLASNANELQISDQISIFTAGILTSFVVGILAIRFLLKYLAKHSLAAFAYYRIGFAVITLVLISS